jgi:hypothetical protein
VTLSRWQVQSGTQEGSAMANDFQINFKDKAKAKDISALQKALEGIGPGPVTQEDGYFTATLDWNTDRKSIANLTGKLNAAANNIVTGVTAT